MQWTEQAQTNTYTPTPCFSVYLDPNWTRAKSSSSSESSSLLPWDMSDRAWNRNDKGLSKWGKRQEGGEGRNDSDDGVQARGSGGYEKDKSGIFLKVTRGQRWWDAGGLHAWSLLLVPLLFLKIHYCHLVCSFNSMSEHFFVLLTDPTITISQRSTNPERCRSHLCLLNISEAI